MPSDESYPQLLRAIRTPQATAMVAGTIIGASIFVQPSEITGSVPSRGGVLLVWAIAGVLTFLGCRVCATCAIHFPDSGGVYVFLRRLFSPALAFLWGWAMFWTMHSGIIAAIGVIFARYLSYFVELGEGGQKLAAVLVILVLTAINCLGVRPASNLQTLFTAGKIGAILLIIGVGFLWGSAASNDTSAATGLSTGYDLNDFLQALVAGLFAFGGWHMVTYNAEETVDPQTTIPRALFWGVLLVTGCYIALNSVYLHLLPLEQLIQSNRVAADAANAVLGRGGGAFMSALVVFSTFGALIGIVLAGPRVYFAMARDGLLFDWVAHVHPRYRTPHRAVLLQGVWASLLVLTGSYRTLFTRVVYCEWIFFGLLAVGLLRAVRKHRITRPGTLEYALWLVFAGASFAIVGNQIWRAPAESLQGLAFVLIGLPVYYLWKTFARPRS